MSNKHPLPLLLPIIFVIPVPHTRDFTPAVKPGRSPRRMLGIPEESTLNPSPQEWEEKKEMTQK